MHEPYLRDFKIDPYLPLMTAQSKRPDKLTGFIVGETCNCPPSSVKVDGVLSNERRN
jgi:hypothetical protein